MCQEYTLEDDDFVEIEPNEWENIEEDNIYQTFELWENLKNLNEITLKLISKGFIDKILNKKKTECITQSLKLSASITTGFGVST